MDHCTNNTKIKSVYWGKLHEPDMTKVQNLTQNWIYLHWQHSFLKTYSQFAQTLLSKAKWWLEHFFCQYQKRLILQQIGRNDLTDLAILKIAFWRPVNYLPCEVLVHFHGAPRWHFAAVSEAVQPLFAAFDVCHLSFSHLQPLASQHPLGHVWFAPQNISQSGEAQTEVFWWCHSFCESESICTEEILGQCFVMSGCKINILIGK